MEIRGKAERVDNKSVYVIYLPCSCGGIRLVPISRLPALAQTSVPNRPGRPIGPARTVVPGVPGRVSQDGRAKRLNLSKTAVLGVDGRALQSLVRWVLPVVICRARSSTVGPGSQL